MRSAPGLKTGAGREGTRETEEEGAERAQGGCGKGQGSRRGGGEEKSFRRGAPRGVKWGRGKLSVEKTQEARGEGAEGTKETQGGSPGAGTRKLGEWAAGSDSGKAGKTC